MDSPTWAAHFGISDADFAALTTQIPEGTSVLQWLLVNGNIPSDEYTRWAMDTYKLPSVRDDYFALPADPVFWEAVNTQFAWTSSFFPLAEWNGVLLIGCIEPPSFHFPLYTPHRFVIASAHALEQRFRELTVTREAEAEVAAPVHVDAHVDVDVHVDVEHEGAPELAPLEATFSDVRQRPADEVLAENLPPAPDVSLDEPDGILFDLDSAESPNLLAVPDGLPLATETHPLPTVPDGFDDQNDSFDLGNLSDAETAVTLSTAVKSPTTPAAPAPLTAERPAAAPSLPSAPPSTLGTSVYDAIAAKEKKQIKAEPPPAPKLPPGPPSQIPVAAPAAAAPAVRPAPVSTAVAQSKLDTPVVPSNLPLVPLTACSSLDQLANMAVLHAQEYFQHALYLTFKNFTLRPAKWSDLLHSAQGENPDAISLEEPSIFRIASRTSLPYHGHVVENPLNSKFFNAFNRGVLPKHVTVMPIVNGGALTGMLVGLTDGDVQYKESLAAMEKLASEFATQSVKLIRAAAKVA